MENSSQNKMTTGNLAIIFGPNLMWSKYDTTSLTGMAKTNTFTKVRTKYQKFLFALKSILEVVSEDFCVVSVLLDNSKYYVFS